jgi:cyd operon protein YbgT
MWYFSWVLGLGRACSFAILNVMWFELRAALLMAHGLPRGNGCFGA